jgi:Tfp pilus assembly protein PilF
MTSPQPGRNDPCPCGSGKKYKQCCLTLERVAPPTPQASDAAVHLAMRTAWQAKQQGNLQQAQAICQRILSVAADQPDALNLVGAIALEDGDIEKAVALLKTAAKGSPRNPEIQNNLGFALHEQGNIEAAINHYRKAIALAPGYANAHYNLHALVLNQKQMAPAIECLRTVLNIDPNDTEAAWMLGVLLDYAGDAKLTAKYLDGLAQGSALSQARFDAWQYLKSRNAQTLPITGCMLHTFKLAFAATPRTGLVLEFGVRHGNTIRQIAKLTNQDVHGFDSFEGLPEAWHTEAKGSYTTKGEIPSVPGNVQLHVGWFEDTLPRFLETHEGSVRFINIDCDIYSSTQTVLELLAPRMAAGSVIVFDEYIGNAHWREDEFKAFQEAVRKYGWEYEYLCFSIFTKQVAVRIKSIQRSPDQALRQAQGER